jgi:osmotically inducible lipoprotein OsmB
MKTIAILATGVLTLATAACNTPEERALGGAAIGGLAGAAIGGAATGRVGGALVGGAVGAAGGAVVGAATTPQAPPQPVMQDEITQPRAARPVAAHAPAARETAAAPSTGSKPNCRYGTYFIHGGEVCKP